MAERINASWHVVGISHTHLHYFIILIQYFTAWEMWCSGKSLGSGAKIMYRTMYITIFLCIKFFNLLSHMQNFVLVDRVDKEI